MQSTESGMDSLDPPTHKINPFASATWDTLSLMTKSAASMRFFEVGGKSCPLMPFSGWQENAIFCLMRFFKSYKLQTMILTHNHIAPYGDKQKESVE